MRRAVWSVASALVVLVLGGLLVSADCGCSEGPEPSCYATFRTNERIGLQVVFPLDFFICQKVVETPMILGWRAETWDGFVVYEALFDEVAGHWQTFEWDQSGAGGEPVEPGFYRLVALTTAGQVAAAVRIIPCCSSCWSCWTCCPCAVCVDGWIVRCPTERCEPYLTLGVTDTRVCCGFRVDIHWTFESP